MNDISSFSIQNSKQIISYLATLFKEQCLISACFGKDDQSYITTLLGINEVNNTVILECGPKDYLNKHVLSADEVRFNTELDGIKICFTGTALKKIAHKGDEAFSMPIPKSFYWRQRRGYYRVKSPIANPGYCHLPVNGKEPLDLKLSDISLTGFAMYNVSCEVSALLVIGQAFKLCKIVLPGVGEISVSFEVCNKLILNTDKLHKIQKIGCKFLDVNNSDEQLIQRYIQQIQRETLVKK